MGGIIVIRDENEFVWKSQAWVYDLIVLAVAQELSIENPPLSKFYNDSSTGVKYLPYVDLRVLTLSEQLQTLSAFKKVRELVIDHTLYPEPVTWFSREGVIRCVTELIDMMQAAIEIEQGEIATQR